jgi:hypothetical protein
MANQGPRGKATRLVPMAHVVDVQRSIDFYKLLAMDLRNSLKSHEGDLRWVPAITYPNYMSKGEIRIEDPDGYVLLIGQGG